MHTVSTLAKACKGIMVKPPKGRDLIPAIVAYTMERTNATPNRPDVVQAEVLATYGVVICLQATVTL